ncbi:MAG TPA: bacterial transcriptional activator domain-containing protein [Actinomycetota bacterium]|nr:bacterial transcriptional activator domain-containing protein [Actinomycetota bacterium]
MLNAGLQGVGSRASDWPAEALTQPYSFLLFGRFQARRAWAGWDQVDARKIQEILSYLLLFRQRPHQREVLAGTLWSGSSLARSRKNLRQSLWQLQEHREAPDAESAARLLLVGKEWIQVNPTTIWLDVAELEAAYETVRTTAGERLSDDQAATSRKAVELYRGDLLEGWQEEWCVFERERLCAIHLTMLEKLLGYCEATGRFEEGMVYGDRLLRHDRAHERAHWRMMRLSYLAGDRTGALRQFDKCRAALAEELGVAPGRMTRALYEQIRADAADAVAPRASLSS